MVSDRGGAVLLRLIIAPLYKGYFYDYRMFYHWSQSAAGGLFSMYHPERTDVYIDYPPFYIIILFFVGIFNKLFVINEASGMYALLHKLPAIFADGATAYIIYCISKKYLTYRKSLILSALYVFNPIMWFDTAVWGQVDSVFFLTVVLMLLFLMKSKYELAAVCLAVSIAFKPQGLMFAPIIFFELVSRSIRNRSVRVFPKAALYGVGVLLAIVLPFTLGNSAGLEWINALMTKMMGSWKYASINAFNLFAFLGANWVEDYNYLVFMEYKTWGDLFLAAVVTTTAFLYLKKGGSKITLLYGALILNVGAFNLSSRMHERYLYPAIFISIMIFIYNKEKRALYVFIATSVTNFLNVYQSFIGVASSPDVNKYSALCRVPNNDPILMFTSLLNVVTLLYVLKLTFEYAFKKEQPADYIEKAVKGIDSSIQLGYVSSAAGVVALIWALARYLGMPGKLFTSLNFTPYEINTLIILFFALLFGAFGIINLAYSWKRPAKISHSR